MAGFSLDSHGSSGAKPGLEALRASEFKTAKGLDSITDVSRDLVKAFSALADSASATASDVASHAATKSASTSNGSAPSAAGDSIADTFAQSGAQLNSFLNRFGDQFNRAAGAAVEALKRIEAHLRFQAWQEALDKVQDKIRNGISDASTKARADLSKIDRTLLDWGPSINKGISALRLFQKTANFLGNLKSIERPLDKLDHTTFAAPAAGAAKLAGRLTGVAPAVNLATRSVKVLGSEIALALGVFGLAYKGVQFFKDGVMGAADLNESVSKSQYVFGAASKTIEDAAQEMADAFRIPNQTFIDGAVTLGRYGLAAGKTKQEAADLGVTFAKMALDLMSQENLGSASEAMDKLSSAISGQVEVLRRHGAFLSEDAVNAEAVRKGYAKNADAIDDAAKVMARMSLIQQDLAGANGDLARTFDQQKNQMRSVGGTWKIVGTEIGKALAPGTDAALSLLTRFGSFVAESFQSNKSIVAAFAREAAFRLEDYGTAVKDMWSALQTLPAAIESAFGSGPRSLLNGFVTIVKTAWDSIGIFLRNLPTLAEIASLKIVEAFTNIGEYASTLAANVTQYAKYIGENWYQLIVDGLNASQLAMQNWGANVANLGKAAWDALSGKGFNFEWKPLLDGFEATASALPKMIQAKLTDLSPEIGKKFAELAENEAKVAAGRAKTVEKAAGGQEAPDRAVRDGKDKKKKKDHDFAGGADFGTAESYKELLKLTTGSGKSDGTMKKIADNSVKQFEVLKRIEKQGIKTTSTGRALDVVTV